LIITVTSSAAAIDKKEITLELPKLQRQKTFNNVLGLVFGLGGLVVGSAICIKAEQTDDSGLSMLGIFTGLGIASLEFIPMRKMFEKKSQIKRGEYIIANYDDLTSREVDAIWNGIVQVGMSKSLVELIKGQPWKIIYNTDYQGVKTEIWYYDVATSFTFIEKPLTPRESALPAVAEAQPMSNAALPNPAAAFIGIKRGDTEVEVLAIYGQPQSVARGSYGKLMFYNHDVVFCVADDNGKVTSISIYRKGVTTIREKGTEDQASAWVMKNRREIMNNFGTPNSDQGKLISYWNTPYGTLWFWFDTLGDNSPCDHMEVRWD